MCWHAAFAVLICFFCCFCLYLLFVVMVLNVIDTWQLHPHASASELTCFCPLEHRVFKDGLFSLSCASRRKTSTFNRGLHYEV